MVHYIHIHTTQLTIMCFCFYLYTYKYTNLLVPAMTIRTIKINVCISKLTILPQIQIPAKYFKRMKYMNGYSIRENRIVDKVPK